VCVCLSVSTCKHVIPGGSIEHDEDVGIGEALEAVVETKGEEEHQELEVEVEG
jgi:hypothetical protein